MWTPWWGHWSGMRAGTSRRLISSTSVAVTALGHPMQQSHVDALVRALVDKAARADAQAIANTIWACATAGYTVQEQQLQLVRALAGMAVRTPGRVDPQAVSNTLWGCATMGCPVQPQECEAWWGAWCRTSAAVSRRKWPTRCRHCPSSRQLGPAPTSSSSGSSCSGLHSAAAGGTARLCGGQQGSLQPVPQPHIPWIASRPSSSRVAVSVMSCPSHSDAPM
jgi:hypothetical protein